MVVRVVRGEIAVLAKGLGCVYRQAFLFLERRVLYYPALLTFPKLAKSRTKFTISFLVHGAGFEPA